jgi:hypothetical protein
MDTGQGHARVLIAAAAFLICGAAVQSQLPLREARWSQADDLASDLTHQPAECLAWPKDRAMRTSAEIGRVMFHAPLLLGGQAARAGLSCSSCHRNGRTNPNFHFPGISGDPGTADVTASIMSEHRGDGIFNPKPIPDLGGDASKLKVKGTPKLRDFIHGLITQEFDGPEPSPAVLDGLVAYVSALAPEACGAPAQQAITLSSLLEVVDDATRLAEQSYKSGDRATGRALIGAARSTLGAIDERFQLEGGEQSRALLRDADSELKQVELADSTSPPMFAAWRESWPKRKAELRTAEPRSLFSQRLLQRAIGAR